MVIGSELLFTLLKDKGLKVTTQRVKTLEVLSSCPNRHLTAEEIYELVKIDCPEIGLATIYRTIQLFLELKLIDRINLDDGFVRYEIGHVEERNIKHRHHHLICNECGKVQSFEDDMLDELEKRIYIAKGFSVVDHEVKLYGFCEECGGRIVETTKRK